MPPVAAAPPIIGTLGRRRRPVRSIRFARNAPRAPPQSPGEGRLPPVRVRLRSSGRARWWHASRRRARRSRVVSALQITTSATREGPPVELARTMPVFQLELGFLRAPQKPTGRVYYPCPTPRRRDLSRRRSSPEPRSSPFRHWHHALRLQHKPHKTYHPTKTHAAVSEHTSGTRRKVSPALTG